MIGGNTRNGPRFQSLARQQRRSGPAHVVAGQIASEQRFAPLCSPTDPETWVTLDQAPSLDALCCTSCGARGSPHITYQQSNVARWGASFFWVHCHLCLAAFGTLIGNVLRTYASIPKENSVTARAAKERRGSSSSIPEPPVTPRGNSSVSALMRLSLTARDRPISPLPSSHSPFMDIASDTAVKTPPVTPRAEIGAANNVAGGVSRKKDTPAEDPEWDCNDWEIPESPIKPKPKSKPNNQGTRELQLQLQLMNCSIFTLPFKVENNVLKWSDLPELVTAHLNSPGTVRALELVAVKGGSWELFDSSNERKIPTSTDVVYGRVVTGKLYSPPGITGTKRETSTRDEVIVLASDSEDDGPSPPKRRRSLRGQKEANKTTIPKPRVTRK